MFTTLRFFFLDFGLSIFKFPLWWYSSGLAFVFKSLFSGWQNYAKGLAINIWIKNIFVPMYGQRDWQSRLISIFMRTVQIMGRFLILCISLLITCIFAVAYILLPVFSLSFLVYNGMILFYG